MPSDHMPHDIGSRDSVDSGQSEESPEPTLPPTSDLVLPYQSRAEHREQFAAMGSRDEVKDQSTTDGPVDGDGGVADGQPGAVDQSEERERASESAPGREGNLNGSPITLADLRSTHREPITSLDVSDETPDLPKEDLGSADTSTVSDHAPVDAADQVADAPVSEANSPSAVVPERAFEGDVGHGSDEDPGFHEPADFDANHDSALQGDNDLPRLANRDTSGGDQASGRAEQIHGNGHSNADSALDTGWKRQPPSHDTPDLGDLPDADRAEFVAYENKLLAEGRTRDVVDGPGERYQMEVCGEIEYRLTDDELLPRAVWADGLNIDVGLAQDAKHVGQGETSFYRPDSLPPFLRDEAIKDFDDRLIKYKEVITDADNPVRGLEIITNNRESAAFFQQRMTELDVPGRVTLHMTGDDDHG